jgi:sec-independent protein translocase protein TatC
MSLGSTQRPDPDDFFSDSRMSFGDHLEDLRVHLWRAVAGFLVGLVIGFIIGKPVMRFISTPVEAELKVYWDRYSKHKIREVIDSINDGKVDSGPPMIVEMRRFPGKQASVQPEAKKERPAGVLDIAPHIKPILKNLHIEDWVEGNANAGGDWVKYEIRQPGLLAAGIKEFDTLLSKRGLITLNAQEGLLGYFKVSIVAGLVLASPWIFYQIWAFIAAGLYPHEKRYVNHFLPLSIGLFLAGVFLCQFFVIPKAVSGLLWFNEWLELEPNLRFDDWLTFAILMPVVFGLSFQTPMVMLFMERIGIVTVESLRAKRRFAWFAIVLVGAVVLPTGDIQSLLFLFVPMCLLYELGILMCVLSPKRPTFDGDEAESQELIEV